MDRNTHIVIAQNISETENNFSKSVGLNKWHFLLQGLVYTAKLHKENLKYKLISNEINQKTFWVYNPISW